MYVCASSSARSVSDVSFDKTAPCSPVYQLRKERSSKPVETRKFIKLYLEFLKDSQRYYRDYIQKLNARFGGIQDLERIARQVRSDRKSSLAVACCTHKD
jgi:hypothetical protein